MTNRRDPFARSTMMRPAFVRVAIAGAATTILWLSVLWAVSLP